MERKELKSELHRLLDETLFPATKEEIIEQLEAPPEVFDDIEEVDINILDHIHRLDAPEDYKYKNISELVPYPDTFPFYTMYETGAWHYKIFSPDFCIIVCNRSDDAALTSTSIEVNRCKDNIDRFMDNPLISKDEFEKEYDIVEQKLRKYR